MENKNIKSSYNLLVLSDFTKTSDTALKKAIDIAKVINGTIQLFHVSRSVDIVKYENQISALRTINEKCFSIRKKLKDLADAIAEKENIKITYDFTIGNVKNEIQKRIKKTNPDIVIIGKRKKTFMDFLKGGLTKFLLHRHPEIILIAGEDHKKQAGNEISLDF